MNPVGQTNVPASPETAPVMNDRVTDLGFPRNVNNHDKKAKTTTGAHAREATEGGTPRTRGAVIAVHSSATRTVAPKTFLAVSCIERIESDNQ